MEGRLDAAVWGFVGVIVGGLITVVGEIIRARNTASLDSARRRDDRRIDRDNFQRSTLIALQAALDTICRVASKLAGARVAEAKAAGHWVPFNARSLPAELAEANRDATMRISTLSSVVLDDEVRRLCREVNAAHIAIATADSQGMVDEAMLATIQAATQAANRCGDVIRDSYHRGIDD